MRSALSLMAHPSSTPNLTSWSRALTLSWTQNSLTKPRDRCIILQGYYYNHSSLNKRSTYTITRGVATGELQATHYASNSQNQNQVDFCPFVLLEISVLRISLHCLHSTGGSLRVGFTDSTTVGSTELKIESDPRGIGRRLDRASTDSSRSSRPSTTPS
ncbi:hypothetical protein NA56DRAFT_482050 [Hyaloscypha hepaticicola]|uniref:Uncharacterized protein n=1 Tax=Hyaloscypha hepaticicola TaxID=2082293 RepID=A0A2J6PEQ2_9HELO|nr:hypothetical protein NA56DRAFT_482050 [Hyaloscypha hepaticicola]